MPAIAFSHLMCGFLNRAVPLRTVTHISFLSIILRHNYTDLNLYSYIFSGLLLRAFSNIAIINTAVNKYFKGVLGGMGNNSNTVIMYLFFHTGTRFPKG